jgi:hypothetical protein
VYCLHEVHVSKWPCHVGFVVGNGRPHRTVIRSSRISTTASYSSPSSHCSCQKDKRLKIGNFHVKECCSVNREN